RVTLEPAPTGARAVVHVMPRKGIDSVRIDVHGAPTNADELLRDADLARDGELVARDVPKQRWRVEAMLQGRGSPAPQVDISTRPPDDPLRVTVVVDVKVGAPRRIERRVVYPQGGTPAEAAHADKTYAAKAGERADETTLDTA